MLKYIFAGALIVSFAAPAVADGFYLPFFEDGQDVKTKSAKSTKREAKAAAPKTVERR
jgi:hypothetical protein